MSDEQKYKNGTRVIVDWDDVGPKPCVIFKLNKKTKFGLRDYYSVISEKGQILGAEIRAISINKQYYREKRLNKILNK